jgi:hypothetical protein
MLKDPIEYLSVSTRENLLHLKLQGVGLQFLLYLKDKLMTTQNYDMLSTRGVPIIDYNRKSVDYWHNPSA